MREMMGMWVFETVAGRFSSYIDIFFAPNRFDGEADLFRPQVLLQVRIGTFRVDLHARPGDRLDIQRVLSHR